METFRLQIPDMSYEDQVLEYLHEFDLYNSDLNGAGGLGRFRDNYQGWLEHLDMMRHIEPSEERVPSITYLMVRNEDNYVVGMINIRLALNETLRRFGGHIGYSIRPIMRGQGLSEIQLYLGLMECLNNNIDEVYLDASVSNVRSIRTILALGGEFMYDGIDPYDNELTNVYRINVRDSLEHYRNIIMRRR